MPFRSRRVPTALVERTGLRRARNQSGFMLIEALGAVVLFVIVAASLSSILVGAIKSNGTAEQRTLAQQELQAQIETIRRMPYDQVGIQSGNPPGQLQASQTVTRSGLQLTVNIDVHYVGDNVPTSYVTGADYKKVTVTILRASDSKQLAQDVTYVSNPASNPLGGINNATVNVKVVDYGNATPVQGATVALTSTNPSANLSDTTDSLGNTSFPALAPNPSSSYYYDVAVSKAGYVTLKDDLSPAAVAHHSLAPSETFNTTIRIYQPATINVVLHNADGSTYTGNATVTVTSSRGSQNFSYTGTALIITSINGEQVVPSLQYTVTAQTSGGLVATPVTKYVPDNYPTVLSTTFTLTFPAPSALVVTVTQGGIGISGANVTVTGGSINLNGTTDSSFTVSFSAINPGTYTVGASANGQNGSTTATTTSGNTTYITIDLPPPAAILATVTWAGQPVSGATVTLTGGPGSVNLSGTSDVNGHVLFSNLVAGSGYNLTATKSGQSASQSNVTATGGSTTNVTLALPTGALTVTVTWAGSNVNGASVTLTGGPMGITVSGTTNASGQVTFTSVPTGSGYTVTATKGGTSGQATGVSVPNGSTGSVTVTMPTGTVTVTVTWGSGGPLVYNANVTLSGGPQSISVSGTTGQNGQLTFTNVPTGSGYSITATHGGKSGSATNQTVPNGSTLSVTVPLTVSGGATLNVNVKRSGSNVNGATVWLEGGPNSITIMLTTNSSGNVSFLNVPTGSGYTIKAWNCSFGSSKSVTSASFTINTGTNNQNVSLSGSTCPLTVP